MRRRSVRIISRIIFGDFCEGFLGKRGSMGWSFIGELMEVEDEREYEGDSSKNKVVVVYVSIWFWLKMRSDLSLVYIMKMEKFGLL